MEAPLQRRPERCYEHSARRPQQYALLYKWRQRKSASNKPEVVLSMSGENFNHLINVPRLNAGDAVNVST
jgi:hypothetical protein